MEAVITIAALFVQLACIARWYPPAEVGNYQLVLAWLFLLTASSCFGGIVMISTRDLSTSEDAARTPIFSTAVALQTIVAILLGVGSFLIVGCLPYFSEIALPLSLGAIAMLLSLPLQLAQGLLFSRDLIGKTVLASGLAHLLATGAIVAVAASGGSTVMLVSAWAVYQIVYGAIVVVQSRAWRHLAFAEIHLRRLWRLVLEVAPMLVMFLATHLYVRIDVIMLDYFTVKETVAQYGASYLFLDQLMVLSNFMSSALYPNFARACLARGRDYQMLYRGLLLVILKYLVPVAVLIAFLSKTLLGLVYGSPYTAAWPALSMLMVAALFAWLNCPSGTIFITLKKQARYMWATILSLAVNVIGNFMLIPWMGALGAATSTALTEAALCAYCLYWIHRETKYLPWMAPTK